MHGQQNIKKCVAFVYVRSASACKRETAYELASVCKSLEREYKL
jgi:hypothetical protein